MITLVIPGKPTQWQRRVVWEGRSLTRVEVREYKRVIVNHFVRSYRKHVPYTGYIEFTVTAYYPIPKSWPKWKKRRAADHEIRPAVVPDWDNIGKLPSDALNGGAYVDDKQIVDAHVHLYYDVEPRLEIKVEEISCLVKSGKTST